MTQQRKRAPMSSGQKRDESGGGGEMPGGEMNAPGAMVEGEGMPAAARKGSGDAMPGAEMRRSAAPAGTAEQAGRLAGMPAHGSMPAKTGDQDLPTGKRRS